jgi:hypothetical protein
MSTVKRWRRRQSECFFEHLCFERYTANKMATYLRAGAKEGGYLVRVVTRQRSSRQAAPWKREYNWVVRVYRKIAY